jgi:predicted nuclease of predicted toxin-antitoxin system
MLRLLSDEDFNGHVVAGLRRSYPEIDLLRAQDVGLSGHKDPDILAWAAEQGRIVLTNDKRTMLAFATQRVAAGLAMPGVFVVRRRTSIQDAIEAVAMVALASDHANWDKQIEWLPL